MQRYMDPTTDFGFKKIFASEQSKPVLKSFLFDLLELEMPIAEVSFLPLEQLPARVEERMSIYDIYLIDERGQRFIVEMQKTNQEFFIDRSVYYSSFPLAQQAQKGRWNFQMAHVYCLGILDFDMLPDDHFIRPVKLVDLVTGRIYYDKLTFMTVELSKFKLSLNEIKTHRDKWIYFLKYVSDLRSIPPELSDEPFRVAFELAEFGALTEAEQYYYEGSLKRLRDAYATTQFARKEGLQQGRDEGIEEGRQAGIEEGRQAGIEEGKQAGIEEGKQAGIEEGKKAEKIAIAEKLIQLQVPMPAILQATGLTQEELEAMLSLKTQG